MHKLSLITLIFSLSCFLHLVTLANDNPLNVFILCGESNMEGHAKISTFEAMKLDQLRSLFTRRWSMLLEVR